MLIYLAQTSDAAADDRSSVLKVQLGEAWALKGMGVEGYGL